MPEPPETPTLKPIKDGWAALAKRWGVHGRTQEEALQKFAEAVEWHRQIDERIQQERSSEGEMSETQALLPCPFCGGQPLLESESYAGLSGGTSADTRSWVVRCRCCAAQGPWFKTEGNAVAGWNRRTAPE